MSRSRGEQRPPNPRQLRVGEAIRHALAASLERGEVRDPGLYGNPVTVTEVRVTPDLRHAIVFVVPFGLQADSSSDSSSGGGEVAAIVAALNRAAPFLRHRVSEAVQLRHAPDLVFRADTTFDEAHRIHSLLTKPDVARDLAPPGTDAEDDES